MACSVAREAAGLEVATKPMKFTEALSAAVFMAIATVLAVPLILVRWLRMDK